MANKQANQLTTVSGINIEDNDLLLIFDVDELEIEKLVINHYPQY